MALDQPSHRYLAGRPAAASHGRPRRHTAKSRRSASLTTPMSAPSTMRDSTWTPWRRTQTSASTRTWPSWSTTPSRGSGRNARHGDHRDLSAGDIVILEPFVMEQQVRPRHCDAQAMVHAARYCEFCEDAFIGWLEYIGTPYPTLRASGVDLMISESRYRYRRPARLDDTLRIVVTGDAATQSSVVARFDLKRDQDVLATAEITYIAVKDGHRCALPAPLQRLAAQTPSAERS